MNKLSMALLWAAIGLAAGCGGGTVVIPDATVRSVRVTEVGPEASRLTLRVVIANPNDSISLSFQY